MTLTLTFLRTRPFAFPLASLRAGHFLCLCKESNQRNTPGSHALRAARYGFARSGRGSLDGHPAHRELARILRATLSGDSGLPSPRLTGPRIKCNSFCAQDARALALWVPMALRRQRTKRPVGSARGIAPIPLLHRMCNQRNPAAVAHPSRTMREGRKALGRVSLGYFSLHEQREVTRSPQASGSLGSKKTKTGFQLALE